jgi:hypothetical protein
MMFTNSHLERARRLFAAQFTNHGDTVVYRKNGRGPAIPLKAQERDRLIARFSSRVSLAVYGSVGLISVGVLALVFLSVTRQIRLPGWAVTLAVLAVVIAFFGLMSWIAQEPARVLAGRAPVAPAVPAAEFRRSALSRLPWATLGSAAAIGTVSLLRVHWTHQILEGENLLWLLAGAGLLLLAVVQSLRKLAAERAGR